MWRDKYNRGLYTGSRSGTPGSVNYPASDSRPSFRAALRPRLAGVLCIAALGLPPATGLRAAPAAPAASNSSVDTLIAKLPDPSQFTKSPLEAAVEDPTEKTPEFLRIVAELKRRDLAGALRDSRALGARYPDSHPKAHLLHGFLALLSKQYDEADKAFHTLQTLTPTHGFGWIAIGRVQFAQKHYPAALADARKSVAVEPSYASGWLAVASCEFQLHHLPEATTAARRATQVDPRSTSAWYTLGRCEATAHKFDQAAVEFRRAADLTPDALPLQGILAICYIEAGRPADAIPPLEHVVAKAPNDVVADTKLGYCYMVTGKAAQGAESCRRAVKIQPKYAAAWDMLGQCYRRAGRNREALDAFQHAVNLVPGDLNVRTHLDETRQLTAASSHA